MIFNVINLHEAIDAVSLYLPLKIPYRNMRSSKCAKCHAHPWNSSFPPIQHDLMGVEYREAKTLMELSGNSLSNCKWSGGGIKWCQK